MIDIWVEEDRDDNIITSGKEYVGHKIMDDYKQKWPDYGHHCKRLSNRAFYIMLEEYAYKRYRYYMHKRRSSEGVMVKFSPYQFDTNDHIDVWFDNLDVSLDTVTTGKSLYNDFKSKYPTSNMMVNTFYKSIMILAEKKFGRKPVKFRGGDGVSFVFKK